MRRNGLIMLTGIIIVTSMVGCRKQPENSSSDVMPAETETTTEDGITIFDKVIKGNEIDENQSLYDVTDEYTIEGYRIITSEVYGNDHIVIVYSGENDSKVCDYTLSDAECKKNVTFDNVVIDDNCLINVYNETTAYIYDPQGKTILYFNFKKETFEKAELDFVPYDYLILDNGDRILYTLKNDNNIYQYIKDSQYTSSVFEMEDDFSNVELVCPEEDDNTIIVKYACDDKICFSELSIENQELTPIHFEIKDLYYSNGKFVCSSENNKGSVSIYDKFRPRLVSNFNFEEADETSKMTFYGDAPFVLTEVNDNLYILLRFYDIEKGIMNNYISISAEYTLKYTNYLEDRMLLDLNVINDKSEIRVLIWDVEKVSKIIS